MVLEILGGAAPLDDESIMVCTAVVLSVVVLFTFIGYKLGLKRCKNSCEIK